MPLATSVNLSRYTEARFPDRCVRCGAKGAERQIRLWSSTVSFWAFMSLLFTRPFSVKVPVCRACAPRLRLARLLKMLITLGFVAIGISIALWVLESYDGPARRWLAILIALACCLPFFIWETLFPPPIDITCYSDTVDYEFADSKYADEFADLNGAARTHD